MVANPEIDSHVASLLRTVAQAPSWSTLRVAWTLRRQLAGFVCVQQAPALGKSTEQDPKPLGRPLQK